MKPSERTVDRKISFAAGIRLAVFLAAACALGLYLVGQNRIRVLEKVIERLSADSRAAEIVVSDTASRPGEKLTTIKFVEYDTRGVPLEPRYFTFSTDIIQFQSLVIRFDDFYIRKGHPLKGKSAYLFMKAFALTDTGAEQFAITKIDEVPAGYRAQKTVSRFERRLWQRFWQYALEPREAKKSGIKNAQIEAPGTRFVPGLIYTLKIEHDGGLRIDAREMPGILRGETKIDFLNERGQVMAVGKKAGAKVKIFFVATGRVEEVDKVIKTDAEWRRILGPEQYAVTRRKATERPQAGRCELPRGNGIYQCVVCGTD
ncbi:MAG: peptide-methionine (R)-S-oxide reductase, partial [Candidatus Omnitrophica bacterium]|nr:peptide-methionine (R)-S-oxide reductase [Candidatus Omnitrophota bacterium]